MTVLILIKFHPQKKNHFMSEKSYKKPFQRVKFCVCHSCFQEQASFFGQHFENARFEFCKTFSEFFFMNLLYVKLKGNQCSTLSLGLHSNSEQPPFLGWRMWVAAVFREGEQMLLKNMAYESIEH